MTILPSRRKSTIDAFNNNNNNNINNNKIKQNRRHLDLNSLELAEDYTNQLLENLKNEKFILVLEIIFGVLI